MRPSKIDIQITALEALLRKCALDFTSSEEDLKKASLLSEVLANLCRARYYKGKE